MTASLTITFEDDSQKTIELANAIESLHGGLQSVEFREQQNGKWLLYFTKRTMDGKKIKEMNFAKSDNPPPS